MSVLATRAAYQPRFAPRVRMTSALVGMGSGARASTGESGIATIGGTVLGLAFLAAPPIAGYYLAGTVGVAVGLGLDAILILAASPR